MVDMFDDAAQKKVEDNPDEKQCRICLQEDDDPNSPWDRLFRPCLCKGTMAYVHGRCLDQWRRHSVKASSMYRCDQCGYEYQMSRLGSPVAIEVRIAKGSCETCVRWLECSRQSGFVNWPAFGFCYLCFILLVLYQECIGTSRFLFIHICNSGKEVSPNLYYKILADLCDGAIYVGPISFVFSALFWLFQGGSNC